MYLKSIEVHGFKSFANKIVFEFHNGITGIVGPNGSGKSNVADAVRWVLGEQRVKQLRSSSMQDVIFAGTENRKPVSFAYVAITLDNSDHQLPLDYNEVTVARRVYRSGESEYLLNGTQCRLKDVNELFYDTGIGKEGYSIIGQGQIDRILSGKPEERRELFDEAAGIVKFKRRKAAALKKLEDEQQNLLRINDILSELERQVGPLERQAEHARIFLKKREELKQNDLNLFLQQMEEIRANQKKLGENHEIADKQQKNTSAEYEQSRSQYEALGGELNEIDGKLESAQKSASEMDVAREKIEGQINVLQEQIHTAQQNESHIQERMDAFDADIARQEQAKAEYAKQEEELRAQENQVNEKKTKQTSYLEDLRSQAAETERKIEEGKDEILNLLNQRSAMKSEQQRLKTLEEQAAIRKSQLNKELIERKSGGTDAGTLLAKRQEEMHTLEAEIAQMESEKADLEEKRGDWQKQFEQARAKMDSLKEAYHKDASRLESLRNIAERYDGYGNSIRRVMEQKDRESGIHGVVADIIHVDKKYETAIETALGGSIQNIVTSDEDTARRMIEYLKSNRYGRATFLPLTSVSAPDHVPAKKALGEAGVIGLADSLVQTEPEYEKVASHLLGRILVVDTIEHAIALARKFHYSLRMVTLEGESLQPGGSMTGGAFRSNSNLLGRNREIELLEKKTTAYKEEAGKIRDRIEDIRTANALLKDDLRELQVRLQTAYLNQNTLNLQIEQMRTEQEKQEAAFADIHTQLADIEHEGKEYARDRAEIAEQIQQSNEREVQIKEDSAALSRNLENQNLEIEQRSQELNDVLLQAAQLNQKRSFLEQNRTQADEEILRLTSEKEKVIEDGAGSEAEIASREAAIQALREQEMKNKEEKNTLEASLTALKKQKEDMTARQQQTFRQQESLAETMRVLDGELLRLNQQMEKLEEQEEQLTGYMWNEYELTYHTAKEIGNPKEPIESIAELKKITAGIREEIRKLGNVNVNAIEEYKSISERYTFLSAQHADLEEAKASLEKIILDLDEGMRKQFAEKFADIQREFDKTFRELFGGGKGSLELTGEEDTKDILECGIQVIAQPPGKKLQNMMQLSGGEKALTAIALLFAIQNLKPSPFCLLDEIEAALDDSNVDRFANYLHKLTKHTQFIVITHRRGTMTAADRLYGITMQEKGVSTLVSVNLIEKELSE